MLMPSIFGETLLDDFWGFPMRDNYMRTANTNGLMQTDVEEKGDGYEITMNLPGFKKEDVKGEIKDGYLTVTASTNTSNEEKDKNGKFIRRERYSGTCSRSFYVGEDVTENDIKAKFTDGVLKIAVPKKEAKPAVEESKYIAIEG
jgi:HSP20 family molecular chaperone IbpA